MDPVSSSVSTTSSGSHCGTGNGEGGGGSEGFVTWYVHHWTGKLMIASDYGYKAWPFGRKKK